MAENKEKTGRIVDKIQIFGAREHNLKSVNVSIPKGKLTIITGPSGSGKSSLALDILFTEGKRRYMDSLSSYARQFLGAVKKPDFDRIEGLCPAIAIEQKTVGSNPRSTVGTITEIYDYLRVLFARVGTVHCPDCFAPISAQSAQSVTSMLVENFAGDTVTIAAPIAIEKKGEFVKELTNFFGEGFYRFVIDGQQYKFKSVDEIKQLQLKKNFKHTIDLLIDVVCVSEQEKSRICEAVESAFKHAQGACKVIVGATQHLYSSQTMCLPCAQSVPPLEPRLFSFNSPIGACPECGGLGIINEWPWEAHDPQAWREQYPDYFGSRYAHQVTCQACYGKRLNKQALAVTIGQKDIVDLCDMPIKQLLPFLQTVELSEMAREVGAGLIEEIIKRLVFLNDVGLSYLTLNRPAKTLSGGEGQRIRLATQIGSALSGVLYILDEPSIGLHQRDNDRLIATLQKLRDLDNTVVVVEHDIDTMRQADYIVDMGPAAGVLGGQVIAVGTPQELAANPASLTGAYLSGKRSIAMPEVVRKPHGFFTLHNAHKNNLRNVTVEFPLGVLCGVSGVSGSGKSTLIMQELVPALLQNMGGYTRRGTSKSKADEQVLTGAQSIGNLVVIDQTPIGKTPRSNPATYLGVFNDIRKLFAALPESNARGYTVGRFSFNVEEGRCFECKGDGAVTVEMHFLPEVSIVCKSCDGKRYNKETLQILYKGKSIADVLAMTAYEAREFFAAHTSIAKRLQLLCDVGLDYVQLGQSSTTLSGGESQRIKLVDELAKRGSNTLYILDEPTTGLHNSDIEKLLVVLNTLVSKGNSMIVIEHNIDVLKTVDYVIDLGPDGGDEGGEVVAYGTPRQVASNARSLTGRYLKECM
jgi:excinuclease ABC subunit A